MIWWFWGPTFAAIALAIIYGVGGYWFNRHLHYPAIIPASGFTGIVRETAKFTLITSGAGLLAAVFAKELAPYRYAQFALWSVLITSGVAAMLNYYMSAALDNRMIHDRKAVKVDSCAWLVVHGVIFGLSLGAIGGLVALIIVVAANF